MIFIPLIITPYITNPYGDTKNRNIIGNVKFNKSKIITIDYLHGDSFFDYGRVGKWNMVVIVYGV